MYCSKISVPFGPHVLKGFRVWTYEVTELTPR